MRIVFGLVRMWAFILAFLGSCARGGGVPAPSGDGGGGGEGEAPQDAGGARRVPWSVSRHVFPGDAPDVLARDLALAAELGATYVRTDLWWYAVEPGPGQFDTAALALYSDYVDLAAAHGLSVIAILSNPPGWALQLYNTGKRADFAAAFGVYSERVAATLGDRVHDYQLWNEPNNVADVPDGAMDIQLFRAGRDGIARGAPGVPVRTAINVLVDGHDGPVAHWEDDIRGYLDGAADAIDTIAIDHYPGTWSVGDWGGNILDRLFALGAERTKAVAIYETGYATAPCSLPLHDEAAQLAWIGEQLPRLRDKLSLGRLEVVNWFKLDDRNSGNCFDPEDNFGVVRTDRTKKPAFEALRAEIARY